MSTSTRAILVVYASKHGATKAIADRVAATLIAAGHRVDLHSARDRVDVTDYDAFVVGSAIYVGCWLKDASDFVARNTDHLKEHPVWLFSSGPLGPDAATAGGRDLRAVSVPQDVIELVQVIHPRDHHVFFGALDPDSLRPSEKAVRRLPAAQGLLPEGDFRDWAEINDWARSIAEQARELDPTKG